MSETHAPPKPASTNPSQNPQGGSERKRILLVEGDGFTRLVLLLRLRLAGFGVDFTSNGIIGVGKLRSCRPDILLVELNLCGLTGLELIKVARSEASFRDRPVYVFTYANRMNRATRKEVDLLGVTLVDKASVTREDLVQIFASTFLPPKPLPEPVSANVSPQQATPPMSDAALSGAIEELVAGVHEQSQLYAQETGPKATAGVELLSRVSSLASCAKAAGLSRLAHQSKALESFLNQLCRSEQDYAQAALSTVTRAVEVMSQMAFATRGKKQNASPISAVFVDEAPYSNRAAEEALLNAGFAPVCFEDPARARDYLASNRTEVIIANVSLPEAHGLAVTDIRQIPLQVVTPVVFGPESAIQVPVRDQLPTSAPRLDKAPILLTEIIVKALNVVNGGKKSTSARNTASAASTTASPAAIAASEDIPETVVKMKSEPVPVLDESGETVSAGSSAIHPQRFAHLFTGADIPSEPIIRAVPVTPDADQEAELLAKLPAISTDATQIPEQLVEELPPPAFETEQALPASPEPVVVDQPVDRMWIASAGANPGQAPSPGNASSESEQTQIAEARESAAAFSNYWHDMNNQLQVAPEDVQPGDSSNLQNVQREDLVERVCAAEMALYHAQAQVEQKNKEIEALQNQITPTGPDNAPGKDGENIQARCAELEEEVAALRQALEGLNGNFAEQLNSEESGKRVQELEQRLSQSAAELEKQNLEHQRAQADLHQQLEAATGAHQQSDSSRQQAETRCAQLERELASSRQAREELANKLAEAQKPAAAQSGATEPLPGASPQELEQQVRQGVAALAKATAELAKERGERQRSQQRTAELNGRLQVLHEDLSRTLQAQRADLTRINTLEEQEHQTKQALDHCQAEVEQQLAERKLAEDQLQKAKELNAQLRKDGSFFEEASKRFDVSRQELQSRLEASITAARDSEARCQQEKTERLRMAEELEQARRDLLNQVRRRESVEQELQATRETLREREAKLQNEVAERQRLNQAQDSLQRNVHNGSERDLEFSKVQSALQLEQVERKRQETQMARLRQSALDSAHAARALRAGMRRQIREPVESLVHSARCLLELEMGEDQKKLVESVLQDVLLVQTRLREPGQAQSEPNETASPDIKTRK